jgi:hypothetical protein
MLRGGPPAQVCAALSDKAHRQVRTDAVNQREVDAGELVHERTHIEAERVGLLCAATRLGRWLRGLWLVSRQHAQQYTLDSIITLVNAGQVEVVQRQRLL